jgi:hypothetical protein
MAWRAKNFLVHAYYEQGVAGVGSWTTLLLGCLLRGVRSWMSSIGNWPLQRPFPMAIYQTVCVVGFVGVGFFGSLIDTPWITALFLGILSMDISTISISAQSTKTPSTLRAPQ